MYPLEFTPLAAKQLRKMAKHQSKLISNWLYRNIDGIEDPRSLEKELTANKSDQWRYRVGNYRIILEIEDNRMVILAIQIGHRRTIYM